MKGSIGGFCCRYLYGLGGADLSKTDGHANRSARVARFSRKVEVRREVSRRHHARSQGCIIVAVPVEALGPRGLGRSGISR